MVLRIGSLVFGGALLAATSACSGDSSHRATGGSSGATFEGGAAGAAQGGLGGDNAGRGGAGGAAGARAGAAGADAAGRGGTGAAGSPQAGLGGEGGHGSGGESGEPGGAGAAGQPSDSRWAGCPTADDYAGDSHWPNRLEVTEGGIYCATFDESRTLKEELAKKALLRIAPGTYRLPTEAAEDVGLPVCVAYGESGTGVPMSPRSIEYTAAPFSGEINHRYTFHAVAPSPDRQLVLGLDQRTPSGETFDFNLDGGPTDFDSFDADGFSFVLCQSLEEPCYADRVFDSCTHESSTLNRHELTLEDGALVLDLRIGASAASTEPGAFVRAAGTFRGDSFEQTNYFRLIYRPEHHHFERHFAVLFDAPIQGACGLEISGFSAFDETTPSVYTVDCELDRLEPVSVSDFSLTRDP